jgi:hypothetical protein
MLTYNGTLFSMIQDVDFQIRNIFEFVHTMNYEYKIYLKIKFFHISGSFSTFFLFNLMGLKLQKSNHKSQEVKTLNDTQQKFIPSQLLW